MGLEAIYKEVNGKDLPEAAHIRLLKLKDALGLTEHDALWSFLVALDYYQKLYDDVPARITETATTLIRTSKEGIEKVMQQTAGVEEAKLKRLREESRVTLGELNERIVQAEAEAKGRMKTEIEIFLKKTAEGVFKALSQSIAEEAAKMAKKEYMVIGMGLMVGILCAGAFLGYALCTFFGK